MFKTSIMDFSNAVIICLLLYHNVVSSECSFLREKISLKEETLLGKFLAETKLFLNNKNARHVTVIGSSDDQLRQVKPLLEAVPHFVGNDVVDFCLCREFTSKSLMVYFLDSLEPEYLEKIGRSLTYCKKARLYYIFERNVENFLEIESILRKDFEKSAKLHTFVHHIEESLKFYGWVLTRNCSGKAELILDWKPGHSGKSLKVWYENSFHRGCPISVGTRHLPPWLYLGEDTNGTVKIIGGPEGEMILTIAQKLDFTPLVQVFKTQDQNRPGYRPTKEIVLSCAAGNTSIGISRIRPREWIHGAVDTSSSYNQECAVWAIPKLRHWPRNIITSEFSWKTWLLIALTFIVTFGLEIIVRNARHPNGGNANRFCSIILDLIGSTIGNPIIYQPLSMRGKVLLITYLLYSTVISTAYRSALSSIFTVDNGEQLIVDGAGIILANITPGADNVRRLILDDQLDDEVVQELLKRFVIEVSPSKALRRISDDQNFAYLGLLTDLIYHETKFARAGNPVSYYMPKRCELIYGNVIAFPKHSYLTERANAVLRRLHENGLIIYWWKTGGKWSQSDSRSAELPELKDTPEDLHFSYNRPKFYYILYIYGLALTFCILVFFGELMFHKFQTAGKVKKIRKFKRPKCRDLCFSLIRIARR